MRYHNHYPSPYNYIGPFCESNSRNSKEPIQFTNENEILSHIHEMKTIATNIILIVEIVQIHHRQYNITKMNE